MGTIYRFGPYRLDPRSQILFRRAEPVSLGQRAVVLLRVLVQAAGKPVSKDALIEAAWPGLTVEESNLTVQIAALRRCFASDSDGANWIETLPRRGYRYLGPAVAEEAESPAAADVAAAAVSAPVRTPSRPPGVQFCTASDGVRIAYSISGEGTPLVKASSWFTHLEYDWDSPVWKPLLQDLAARHRLLRYDQRGNGLSDWDAPEISFERFVSDLETVVDRAGFERFALLGISQGCAVSIAYAVRHPERVTRLVLYGGFVDARSRRGTLMPPEQQEAVFALMLQGWGQENPVYRQMFTSLALPDGTPEQIQWYNELERITASPENAVRVVKAINAIDLTEFLAHVTQPTLVIHRRGDAMIIFEEGGRLASMIPGARFVALDGRNHVILEGEKDWPRFLQEMRDFLRA